MTTVKLASLPSTLQLRNVFMVRSHPIGVQIRILFSMNKVGWVEKMKAWEWTFWWEDEGAWQTWVLNRWRNCAQNCFGCCVYRINKIIYRILIDLQCPRGDNEKISCSITRETSRSQWRHKLITWWKREPIVDISSTLFYKNIEGQYLKNKEDQFQSKDSWRQVEFKNIV